MSDPDTDGMRSQPAGPLVEHFFRHESGRLVAALTRLFGLRHLDVVEDMVQSALVEALQCWRVQGVPDNPSAWMRRVAKNKVLDALRRRDTVTRLAPEWYGTHTTEQEPLLDDAFLDSEIEDSQLRMIFACCHPHLAREAQIALTLKTLCGFSNAEIARGLLANDETIKKRLQRARQHLVASGVSLDVPSAAELPTRLDSVHQVLYLLFNEGYCSGARDTAIRTDLCEEAARLCHLLCCHSQCSTPATFALLALMLFHAARLDARLDEAGRVLLLEEQNRTKWDRPLIARAKFFLERAAAGNQVSTYHLEAGIAMHYCLPDSFAQTDWRAILRLYDLLIRLQRSPIYLLNRAIVIAHIDGAEAGIQALDEVRHDESLRSYHLLDSTLGELHRRAGNLDVARRFFEQARSKTQSLADRELLDRRIALCQGT